MNIRNIALTAVLMLFCCAASVKAQSIVLHKNCAVPSQNREITRPQTLPFSSKAESLAALASMSRDTINSLYVRNLNGEWGMCSLPSGTSVEEALRAGTAEGASKVPTVIPQKTRYSDAVVVYSRNFRVPFAWIDRQIFLRMERVSGGCYLFVNGRQVGYCSDSRTAAEFDITKYAQEGRNTVALVVYSSHALNEFESYMDKPQAAIEGGISLIAQPKIRIRDLFINTYRDELNGDGVLSFGVAMKTHLLNSRTVTLMYELLDPQGEVISADKCPVTLDMRGEDTVEFYVRVPKVKLWSSESPNLYTLVVKSFYEGRYPEYVSLNVGFRRVAVEGGKLMINNRRIPLRSVSYDPYGKSIEAVAKELEQMRALDINTLIIKDGEPMEWFFTLCDRQGFYVFTRANIDTRRSGVSRIVGGAPANNPVWLNAYVERSVDSYLGSHRHASSIGYILGEGGGNGYALYEAYLAVKRIADKRPIVCLQAGAEWNSDMTPADILSAGRDRLLVGDVQHWKSHPTTFFEMNYNGNGELMVKNLNNFADMSDYELSFRMFSGKRVARKGVIPVSISAGQTAQVTLPGKKFPEGHRLVVNVKRLQDGQEVFSQDFGMVTSTVR